MWRRHLVGWATVVLAGCGAHASTIAGSAVSSPDSTFEAGVVEVESPAASDPEAAGEDVDAIWARLRQDFPLTPTPDDAPTPDLQGFFADRWRVPAGATAPTGRALVAKTRITLDSSLHIIDFELVASSGDPDYDASCMEVLLELQRSGTPLPPIPAAIRSHLVEHGMILSWRP